jgi:hypothetical protein
MTYERNKEELLKEAGTLDLRLWAMGQRSPECH